MIGTLAAASPSHWQRYRVLYLLLAVCVAPVIASYAAYYLLPPEGRTNYGTLIEPQRPLPRLTLRELDGASVPATSLRGSWTLLQVDGGACETRCESKLWKMRQIRLTTGRDADRVQRAWLIIDEAPLATMLMREFDGTRFLRASAAELGRFLPLPEREGAQLTDHIWLVDPLGNLMLRWPKEADPNRMKKDLARLLKASRVG